ncbi:MAG TPA: ribonuclease HII [Anaerolineales bacterium]|nr:ribonuclease HII [Anaerolineales bacterium]HRF46492.1 ribonuclease HII [Anaerolineales bacterium]
MPDLSLEAKWQAQGHSLIAGIDEAGRGAWAGPVVAAAVILPLDRPDVLEELLEAGVNDSKQVSARKRRELADLIRERAVSFGMGGVSAAAIDRDGILSATRTAMRRAVSMLRPQPQALLIDAVDLRAQVPLPQQRLNYGDSISLSIAAASILAKVSRDAFLVQLDDLYPGYAFGRHKGYGTRLHQSALAEHGPSPIHRMSFKPIKEMGDL